MTYYQWLLDLIQVNGFNEVSPYTLTVFEQTMGNANILGMMIGG